jgi:hypothetical protein
VKIAGFAIHFSCFPADPGIHRRGGTRPARLPGNSRYSFREDPGEFNKICLYSLKQFMQDAMTRSSSLIIFSFLLLVTCNQAEHDAGAGLASQKLDSEQRAKLTDTVNMKTRPVEIVFSKFVSGTVKKIRLNYHSLSEQKIRKIQFLWYGLNAENAPADNGLGHTGISGGNDDNGLEPGAYGSGEWEAGGKNMVKMVAVWPSEVIYADGTWWHAGKY